MDRLRERMRGLGFSYDEIAIEVTRRYLVRPRQAYRLAWGWTLDKVAERFNELAAREGTDPEGRAGMSSSHLCEPERWPDSDRKPSVYVLCLLAKVYETDVLCLLDLADHEGLPQHDRLVLMRRLRAETPFGARVLVLADERGLSLWELARRVPCDASHLSKVVHGRKRPPRAWRPAWTTPWRRPGNWSSSRGRSRQPLTTPLAPAGSPLTGRP
jgi:transcriptional regulator with XRE-family HTH domain